MRTYIVRRQTNWQHIARLTGISEEELMRINGATSNTVRAYQPICLPEGKRATMEDEDLLFAGV